jgi:hypothetical protein
MIQVKMAVKKYWGNIPYTYREILKEGSGCKFECCMRNFYLI